MTVQAEKDSSVLLAITKTKKLNKPSAPLHKSALNKKFSKMSKAFSNKVFDSFELFYSCFFFLTIFLAFIALIVIIIVFVNLLFICCLNSWKFKSVIVEQLELRIFGSHFIQAESGFWNRAV